MRRIAATLALMTSLACGPSPNPAVPPPSSAQLAGGGVWIAYNLGCKQGCDQIQRGDRIVAVDGQPVNTGAELDAAGITRGEPVALAIDRHKGGKAEVTIVATPNNDYPPIKDAPPFWTVGAKALDRAPEWARLRLFGHAIPALRMYRGEDPRGYVNGREMYGRGAVILVWELPWLISQTREMWNELPKFYAQLQAQDAALQAAGVDTYFVFPTVDESRQLRPEAGPNLAPSDPSPEGSTRFAINKETRDHIRSLVPPGTSDLIPLFLLESAPNDPNTVGLEHQASDIREWLFDRIYAPVILVIDHRGIVRFHTRDFPIGPKETIDAAVQFALTQLGDGPPVAAAPAAAAPVEAAPAAGAELPDLGVPAAPEAE